MSMIPTTRYINKKTDVLLFTNKSGDTQYSDGARRIWFDDFSALRHGDVVIMRTFVLCVLGCK